MSTDNNKLQRTNIITPISDIQYINSGARGDCLHQPWFSIISNKTMLDSIDNKDKYLQSTVNFDYETENYFRSNLASGEPEQHQLCFSTSSATFIVSTLSPSEIMVQQDDYNNHKMIHSKTSMELFTPTRIYNNYSEQQLWFKRHWISIVTTVGVIVIVIIIISTGIIY